MPVVPHDSAVDTVVDLHVVVQVVGGRQKTAEVPQLLSDGVWEQIVVRVHMPIVYTAKHILLASPTRKRKVMSTTRGGILFWDSLEDFKHVSQLKHELEDLLAHETQLA